MRLRAAVYSQKASPPSTGNAGLFARLQVSSAATSMDDALLRLRLGNQLQLDMHYLPPVEWLAALLRLEGVR